jgi:hypothetical protein
VKRRALAHVDTADDDGGGDNALFWSIVDEHPLCRHQQAYADFSATRLSDVAAHRQLAASRVYAEWFRPAGIVAEMEAGIARSRTPHAISSSTAAPETSQCSYPWRLLHKGVQKA